MPIPLQKGRPPSNLALAVRGAVHMARFRLRERWPEERIRAFQDGRLRTLVAHAAAHVPYYREMFRNLGLKAADIRTRRDLALLPALSRQVLRERPEELLSELAPRDRLVPSATSGSTAVPITMWYGPEEFILGWSFFAYGLLRSGGRMFDRYAMLVFHANTMPRRRAFFEKLRLFGTESLDLNDPVEVTLPRLEQLRPDVLYGHPSTLHLLAHHALEYGTTFRPRLVLTHGEMLYPETRALLRQAFRCDVRSTYGASEAFRIACECGHGRLHVLPDSAIVEVDPSTAQEDGSGDVLVTPLYLRTMPLLRYRLGDMIAMAEGPCPCGSKFEAIGEITGRTDDWITLPGGRRITARHIRANRVARLPGVLQVRLVQKSEALFTVLVKAGQGYGEASAAEIRRMLKASFEPSEVEIQIQLVDDFPRRGAGKHRTVVSEVPPPPLPAPASPVAREDSG